ncbi:WIAG-tail domain, partial [Paenibacillus sepulcri]|nr:WIAG-tail domain [Paenibacillus sepulcri]
AGSVTNEKLAPEAVITEALAAGAVTSEKLAAEAVGQEQLQAGAVTLGKIAPGSITTANIIAGSIESDLLCDEAVTGDKIAPGTLTVKHFAPDVLASLIPDVNPSASEQLPAEQVSPAICQQFGLIPYNFAGQGEQLELTVTFDQPFASDVYVLVATADQLSCYATIKSKTADSAELTVVRTRISPEPVGFINWIAIGSK